MEEKINLSLQGFFPLDWQMTTGDAGLRMRASLAHIKTTLLEGKC